jgi:hypothetical protein
MKYIVTILSFITYSSLSTAQSNLGTNYTTAVGVKVYPGAISVKHFKQKNKALEGLGYISSDGFRLTGLYEMYYPLGSTEGLQWFIGAGAHIGVWSEKWKLNNPTRESGGVMGVDGIIGIDYKVKGAPLNLSFDWQPSFNLIGYNYFESGWGGLAIRYTF